MPKIVDHDAYRRELLEKCFHLFSRKGYRNVTMREIAREIGVSTGTLYHYFPTKEGILEQMFAFVSETNVAEYMSRTPSGSLEKRLDALTGLLKEHEQYHQNVMLLALDLFRANGQDDSERVFAAFADTYTEAISRMLLVSPQLARSIFVGLLGLVFHSLLTPHHISFADQISFMQKGVAWFLKLRSDPSALAAVRAAGFPASLVAQWTPGRRRENGTGGGGSGRGRATLRGHRGSG